MKEVIIYFHDREPITFEVDETIEDYDLALWISMTYVNGKEFKIEKIGNERKRV